MRLQVSWVFLPLYCKFLLRIRWALLTQVDQSPQALVTGEGKVSTMSCAFTSKYQTFHWYQKLPRRGLTYLLSVSPQENATEQRFVGQPLEDGKRSSLHITDSQLGDSGSYLCAVRAQ
uniref:Ig-like domain-containing protein n=1 Tax=Chelonoidis abingdonii TaxID=106734 RepID=A0A8C0H0J4_CHEAB